MKDIKPFLGESVIFLNLAKGLEVETDKRLSQIIVEVLDNDIHHVGCLSGGMIAREVTLGNPLCADIAFDNVNVAREVEKIVTNKTLRFDISSDVIGVEYAGALKNVIAIGAGIFDGLEYMESSKSAYVSYMAKEIKNLALFLEARDETFSLGSQAWLGDLMTTCFGGSRNLEFGSLIGKGHKPEEAMEIMTKEKKSVEGYLTIKVAKELAGKTQIKTPLLNGLYDVVHGSKDPKDYVDFVINHW